MTTGGDPLSSCHQHSPWEPLFDQVFDLFIDIEDSRGHREVYSTLHFDLFTHLVAHTRVHITTTNNNNNPT